MDTKKRICIFYDGYAFKKTGDYFKFGHPIHRRIDFNGFDTYMINKVAEVTGVNERTCAVIGRHLYMGTLTGRDETPEQAKKNSNFREILKHNNITPHFRPLQPNDDGTKSEKMVDSDLIADALEMAYKREFDVLVLIAKDKDFVPMIEKLNKLAIDSVLFWWDVPEYTVDGKPRRAERTAEILINAVTYHFEMSPIADKRKKTQFEQDIFHEDPELRPPTGGNQTSTYQKNVVVPPVYESRHPGPEPAFTIEPIENLFMNATPRELSQDELSKKYESVVISLTSVGNGGYVKGPACFFNPKLNNFHFGIHDIGNRLVSDFIIGTKVQFRLKYDLKRSELFSYPLYRAYDITIV